jgi:hypothetical protein
MCRVNRPESDRARRFSLLKKSKTQSLKGDIYSLASKFQHLNIGEFSHFRRTEKGLQFSRGQ